MKCQLAGAGVMVFIWIVGAVASFAFEKQLGLYSSVILWVLIFVGIWLGYETMRECRKPSPPPSS